MSRLTTSLQQQFEQVSRMHTQSLKEGFNEQAEILGRELDHLNLQISNARKPWEWPAKLLSRAVNGDREIQQARFEQQVLEWERDMQMAEVERLLAEELAG